MLQPVKYDRRFRTTLFRLTPLAELRLFAWPEVSRTNHMLFENQVNYVYLCYVLRELLRMPHVQILEKILTFVYLNEDFFNGDHRYQVDVLILFVVAVQNGDFSLLCIPLHSLERPYSPHFPPIAHLQDVPNTKILFAGI